MERLPPKLMKIPPQATPQVEGITPQVTPQTQGIHPPSNENVVALDSNFVRSLFPDKPKHPRQRYLLTVKGLMLLDELVK